MANYSSDMNDVMEVLFIFSDMPIDEYGWPTPPGNEMQVMAYMPFDIDGNISTGTYEVTADYGASMTIAKGYMEIDEYWGDAYYFNSYFGVYLTTDSYWPEENYLISDGTMTVSGSAGNYTFEFNFTTDDGTAITGSYKGALEISGIPAPYSCLTGDYTLNLNGAVANIELAPAGPKHAPLVIRTTEPAENVNKAAPMFNSVKKGNDRDSFR